MIPEAAVKSLARRLGVDPGVIDRDHALGVVLWALAPNLASAGWVFKGGTCLRKCYFGDYRFSEDLDFTVTGRLRVEQVLPVLAGAASQTGPAGVLLDVEDATATIQDDEYGRESIEVKLPYHGVLRTPGTPSVQFHLSADDEVLFGPSHRGLLHGYDDAAELGTADLASYALEEILAEKLRAIAGQRRYAIARDVYDIAQLARRGADAAAALEVLPRKAARKSVVLDGAAGRFRDRRGEYRTSWEKSLAYLMVEPLGFDEAFETAAGLLDRVSG